MTEWANTWGMTVGPAKCGVMVVPRIDAMLENPSPKKPYNHTTQWPIVFVPEGQRSGQTWGFFSGVYSGTRRTGEGCGPFREKVMAFR